MASPTSVKEGAAVSGVPRVNFLDPVEPNPFRENTSISFGITRHQHVHLSIYDAMGRNIRDLVNEIREAGHYNVTWDGRDDAGQRLPSGVYFVKLTAGSFSSARKVVLR